MDYEKILYKARRILAKDMPTEGDLEWFNSVVAGLNRQETKEFIKVSFKFYNKRGTKRRSKRFKRNFGNSILSEEEMLAMKRLFDAGKASARQLSENYNVSLDTVYASLHKVGSVKLSNTDQNNQKWRNKMKFVS